MAIPSASDGGILRILVTVLLRIASYEGMAPLLTALAPDSSVPSTPADEELAKRALGGDKRALAELCRSLVGPVYRLCLRMLGDVGDAQDASQEVRRFRCADGVLRRA